MQLHFSHNSASVSFSVPVFPTWAAFSSFAWFHATEPIIYLGIFIVCEVCTTGRGSGQYGYCLGFDTLSNGGSHQKEAPRQNKFLFFIKYCQSICSSFHLLRTFQEEREDPNKFIYVAIPTLLEFCFFLSSCQMRNIFSVG